MTKKFTQMGQIIQVKKVSLAAVFKDVTRRRPSPEEASIHTGEIKAIKSSLKRFKKKKITICYISVHGTTYYIYNILC